MRPILATVTFPSTSGFAEDAVVNTFAIRADDSFVGDGTDLGEITLPLASLYNGTPSVGSVTALRSYLSGTLSRASGAARIKLYDLTGKLDGTPHGSPFAEDSFTLGAAGSNDNLPEEVALVGTLRASGWATQFVETADGSDADSAPDRPRQRYSGRIYFGPFNITANSQVSGRSRPAADLRNAVVRGLADLDDDLQVGGHALAVWSRKAAQMRAIRLLGGLPGAVSVDDAWDTQRRRGVDPTVRTTIVLDA